MAKDDHLIATLLNALEEAYLDRTVYVSMIMTYHDTFPQIGDWEKIFEELKAHARPKMQKQFSALRLAVARAQNWERALQEFLKETAPKGPVH